MKSKSSNIMSSIRERVMEYVPKEYSAYMKCSQAKCSKEREAYNKSLEGSDDKLKACSLKTKDNKTMKKCVKDIIQGTKEYKSMRKCAMKNCAKERKTLRSSIKKYKSHLMNHIKSHVSKSKKKSKSKSKSKSSRK
jgi:hypothetical protein